MTAFLAGAASRYGAANAETIGWMLDRPPLRNGFLNTKVNPLSGAEYGPADGMRGPDWLYGWIQGRGLEALVMHAPHLPAPLRDRAMDRARAVYDALSGLVARDGGAAFRYGPDGQPVQGTDPATLQRQDREAGVRGYADAFAAKGLVAAAARLGHPDAAQWRTYLADVVAAIPEGRFVMVEAGPITRAAAAVEPADYGPRMILLGAAALLHELGLPQDAGFAAPFIDHVLTRHLDTKTGLLRNVPGQDACNPGHAIEFAGFALASLPADADPALVATLARILTAHFDAAFDGSGIALSLDVGTGRPTSPYRPWWSLPEAIRAAALVHARLRDMDSLRIWQCADEAFFRNYWRAGSGYAVQTRDATGPVDFVPATPDLDPGYHTGLSLLVAARVADALCDSNS
jgi:mannose/cellobiose epimerase-like protein (N-acyl-D-glucosamine 2-epimerase family)